MTTTPAHGPRRAALRRAAAVAALTAGTIGLLGAAVAPAASAAAPSGGYRCQGGLSDGRWLDDPQVDFDACRADGGDPVWVPDPDTLPVRPPEFLEG
jgi:hypothetical protein